ncbi:MAG: glycosyltransferase family 4 protein [Anaerolineales bacterium]|nr:MAG: glycosyltransferase family 4 protein [Anaerolineales bacterium]
MPIYIDVAAAVHGRAGLGRYAESLAGALVVKDPARFALFFNRSGQVRLPTRLQEIPSRSVRAGYKPWRMAIWLGQLAGLGFDRLLPGAELYHATEHLLMPLRHVPTVLTVHDLIFRLFPQHHKRLNYWYLNAAMPLFCRRASAIIAVSQATKRDLVNFYGLDPAKISVVHEAAAPHFAPAPPDQVAQVQARYRLPDCYLLHVGTIEPRKNLNRLLKVVYRLRRAGEDIRVVIVGSKGWLYEDFFRQLEELALGDTVVMPGFVPDTDLPALYSGARLVVVPSHHEGFGLPVLEGMACGTPVACSDASSLPEVGGQAARYFDPTDVAAMADQILAIWRDESLRETMRQQGLARAAQFSWKRAADETLAVYTRVTGSK